MTRSPLTASSSAYCVVGLQTIALRNHPNKPVYDVTFALKSLRSKQMDACEQTRVAYAQW